jgi:hypothetical protein
VRKLLQEIPVYKGLYHVEHTKSAHTAMETVTVNDLHHWISHITPNAVKLLVKKKIVKGIHLNETQSIHTCNSCEFTKTSRKAIECEHVAEHAKSFGDEVPFDLWGPTPVTIKGGKDYYVSFTDDHT